MYIRYDFLEYKMEENNEWIEILIEVVIGEFCGSWIIWKGLLVYL